ncbi:MAG TPA: ISNCY family transposase, partial [Fibrobacteraceae bacterium]|nr:ISNCY family transposase [Fibrobacteraceae bacterium]
TRIEEGIKKGIEQGLQQGLEQGLQQGIEQGIQKGVEQGALNAKREMAKVLKEQGIPMETIAKASGLSEDEIKLL